MKKIRFIERQYFMMGKMEVVENQANQYSLFLRLFCLNRDGEPREKHF